MVHILLRRVQAAYKFYGGKMFYLVLAIEHPDSSGELQAILLTKDRDRAELAKIEAWEAFSSSYPTDRWRVSFEIIEIGDFDKVYDFKYI